MLQGTLANVSKDYPIPSGQQLQKKIKQHLANGGYRQPSGKMIGNTAKPLEK
jgi:hypothetical protein